MVDQHWDVMISPPITMPPHAITRLKQELVHAMTLGQQYMGQETF